MRKSSLSGDSDPVPRRGDDEDATVLSDPGEEMIDEASEESFPASDSPSTWSGPPTEYR